MHWGFFFQWGNMAFIVADWPKEHFYYSVLRAAMTEPVVPYYVLPDFGRETKFLGVPETVLSPQIFLLIFTGLGKFVLINTWFMYTLGFVGCLLIRKRFQLSLLPFIFLFLLFNFNGHITAHLAVGNSMWLGYFLLPFFFLLILELAQCQGPPRLIISVPLSLVLFDIILQGSFHFFVWCVLFLAFFAVFNRQHLRVVGLTFVLSLFLSAVRLLPAAVVNSERTSRGYNNEYYFGTFVDALTSISAFGTEHSLSLVGWWELDVFIGIIGVVFIAYFGIYRRFSANPDLQGHQFKAFDLPNLMFVLISFGVGYDLIRDLGIPFVSYSERVPARFLIMPLVALILISSIRMESFLNGYNRTINFNLLSLAAIVVLAHQLGRHSWTWKVGPGSSLYWSDFTFNEPARWDLLYTTAVTAGGFLTLASLIGITIFLLWKEVGSRVDSGSEPGGRLTGGFRHSGLMVPRRLRSRAQRRRRP